MVLTVQGMRRGRKAAVNITGCVLKLILSLLTTIESGVFSVARKWDGITDFWLRWGGGAVGHGSGGGLGLCGGPHRNS